MKYRRTTLLIGLCLAFLTGLGIARIGYDVYPAILWIAGVLALLFVVLRRTLLLAFALLVLCGGLGLLRGNHILASQSKYQSLYGHTVSLTAVAMSDAVYGKHSQLTFDVHDVRFDSGYLPGRVQVSGFGMNAVYQGDMLNLTGTLYGGHGVYQGRMSFAQIHLDRHHDSVVSSLRRKFAAGMQSALPEPLAPFAMGLLVGQRATLPDSIKRDLLKVGLTHIIAVSGYNLTIILQASRRVMGRRSKRISTWLTAGLMALFLLLAGASASIVRAAMISMLSLAASYYGRSFRPLLLIVLAAAITAGANPVYLWADLSWYLSFLAFFGIMLVAPVIITRLPQKLVSNLLVAVAIESVCAELMTLPLVLYQFGQMSLISLPANMLVVTLIPLAMLLSVIAGFVGMTLSSLAGWFAWPAILLLNYMLDTAHLLASLPGIFVEQIGFSVVQMAGVYAGTLLLLWLLTRKTNIDIYAKITEKKLVTT